MKRLALVFLIVCIGVSGCGLRTPAKPLTSCFSADLTVTDAETAYSGRLTVGEKAYEWVLTAPPTLSGCRLCCDGEQLRLTPPEGEPLVAAMGILPADGFPVALWCALFDSDRTPPAWDGDAAVSEGDTPDGRYRLQTDGQTGHPLRLKLLSASWSAAFENCTILA